MKPPRWFWIALAAGCLLAMYARSTPASGQDLNPDLIAFYRVLS